MRLDKNFSITYSLDNWILKFESDPKPGTGKHEGKTVTSKSEWYYCSLVMALKAYVEKCPASVEELKDISDAIAAMQQAEINVHKLLKRQSELLKGWSKHLVG